MEFDEMPGRIRRIFLWKAVVHSDVWQKANISKLLGGKQLLKIITWSLTVKCQSVCLLQQTFLWPWLNSMTLKT